MQTMTQWYIPSFKTLPTLSKFFFLLTIFFLPAYLLRGTFFSVPVNGLDILETLSIFFCILSLVLSPLRGVQACLYPVRISESGSDGTGVPVPYNTKIRLIFIGFFLILIGTLLSAFLSNGFQPHELGILKSWIILPFLFVFFGYLSAIPSRAILLTYITSATVVSFISLLLPDTLTLTYDHRLRGWYESPNQLALFIAPAIILLYFSLKEKISFRKTIFFIILSFAFFETHSLGSFISVFISILFGEFFLFLFASRHCEESATRQPIRTLRIRGLAHSDVPDPLLNPLNLEGGQVPLRYQTPAQIQKAFLSKKTKILLIFTISLSLVFTSIFFLKKMDERSSLASRITIWKTALHIGTDHPLFGIGPGNFQTTYLEYQKFSPPYLEWAVPHPHNILLMFWLSSGLLGLLGFSILILTSVRNFIYSFFSNQGSGTATTPDPLPDQGSGSAPVPDPLLNLIDPERGQAHQNEPDPKSLTKKTADLFMIGVFSALLSILLSGITDTPIWGNALSVIFWILIFNVRMPMLECEDDLHDQISEQY